MKKSNYIFRSIIAIAAVTIFSACNKEIAGPQNDLNSGTIPAQAVNFSSVAKTKKPPPPPIIYPFPDSTMVNR